MKQNISKTTDKVTFNMKFNKSFVFLNFFLFLLKRLLIILVDLCCAQFKLHFTFVFVFAHDLWESMQQKEMNSTWKLLIKEWRATTSSAHGRTLLSNLMTYNKETCCFSSKCFFFLFLLSMCHSFTKFTTKQQIYKTVDKTAETIHHKESTLNYSNTDKQDWSGTKDLTVHYVLFFLKPQMLNVRNMCTLDLQY